MRRELETGRSVKVERSGLNFLDEIIALKREEVARKKAQQTSFDSNTFPSVRDFQSALRGEKLSVIAEIKRCSPSKGIIRNEADPARIAAIYEENGAAAISVLTDETYFCGHDRFVSAVKGATGLPVLRKEFIIDAYQIDESRALGADAILIIAALLDHDQMVEYLNRARELDLACLVEVHSEEELHRGLTTDACIIGINNRDLSTMQVDLSTSLRLRRLIPPGIVTVSESGIQGREDVRRLEEVGFDAVLAGESLMSSPDIGAKLRELRGA